jgi:hypothetical protein
MSNDCDSLFFVESNNVPANLVLGFGLVGRTGNAYFQAVDSIKEEIFNHYEFFERMEADKQEIYNNMLLGMDETDIKLMRETDVYCRSITKTKHQKEQMNLRAILKAKLRRLFLDLAKKVFVLSFTASTKISTPTKKSPSKRLVFFIISMMNKMIFITQLSE